MAENKLFLLDGMALAYRAHFALIRNPITNSKGINTSAIYGFANTLISIIENENPTHLAVAFDTSAPTVRHETFPDYKAQRDAMPEELAYALPRIKELCGAMNIPILENDGYEADDIIGTLTKVADADGSFQSYMVTPDKDFAQLVSERTFMWKPGRKGAEREVLGIDEIRKQWEVDEPGQVIDILGLWGDSVDNIPGVPGIGEKTAKKLVKQYGSVEGLLQNISDLKGKQKEKVEENQEQARLSKELATIITDAPVTETLNDLMRKEMDKEALMSLFSEWEFRTLSKRLLGEEVAVGGASSDEEDGAPVSYKTLKEVPHNYILVETDEQAAEFYETIKAADTFCFDIETTGLNRFSARILGIAFCAEKGKAYYVPYGAQQKESLRTLFNSEAVKIGHNLKFDLGILLNHGIPVTGKLVDTMLIHSLISPGQKHGMDALAETLLGYQTIKLSELAELSSESQSSEDLFSLAETSAAPSKKGKKKEIAMNEIPLPLLAEYACEDVDITWQLAETLLPQLKEHEMEELYEEVEAPLLNVLTEIEMTGISLSQRSLIKIGERLERQIDKLSNEITEAAGQEFNLNSPKQLGEILFGEMKLVEKPKKTKTGQYVTNEQILSTLAPKHKIVADILEYRVCTKLKNTYVDALPNHLEPATGRVHTTLHQLQAATGRLASSDPNLQNIPIRSEMGKLIRAAFVPRGEEFTLLACDYSQIELRVMAAVSGDPGMITAFKEDKDIHTATAGKVFQVEEGEVTREMRGVAKMVNFGIIYGISAFGLSQRLDIPRKEAADIIEAYFQEYPQVKLFMEKVVEEAKEKGYVETLKGRRRLMPDLNSSNGMTRKNAERATINTPIQGTAADMIKLAMIKVRNHLQKKQVKSQLLLQVHDELLFDLHQDEHDLIPEIIEIMEEALPLPHGIPAKVDYGLGENWLEAH